MYAAASALAVLSKRCRWRWVLGAAMLTVTGRAEAQEEQAVCDDSRVRIQGRPDERWLEPITRACEELVTMPDTDPSARAVIGPADHDLVVEVVLKDGRSTMRRVKTPAALRPTLEALLTIPPARSETAEVSQSPAATLPSRLELPPAEVERRTPSAEPVPPPVRVELGGAVGGRVAGSEGYVSFAPSAFAQLAAGAWLFGMTLRWDLFQGTNDAGVANFEMETVGVGLAIARRFAASFGSVDLGVSPRLLAETQSFESTAGRQPAEQIDTATDVRFGTFTRVAFGSGALRMTIEADAEVSPARIRRSIRLSPELPPLPGWSVGLGLGVAWGAR